MDAVIRAAVIYGLLLLVMRAAGRRTLSDTTTFDLVLLLVIAEAVQPALTEESTSLTTAAILVVTLVTIDIGLSLLKMSLPGVGAVVEGVPTVLVANGRPLPERMRWARVQAEDILEAARSRAGVSSMQKIRYAVLESSGQISIIPSRSCGGADRPLRAGA